MGDIKTKSVRRINEKRLLVTVDISKTVHTGYYRLPDGVESNVFAFENNRAGFDMFLNKIREGQRIAGLENAVVGYEASGPYAEGLLQYLQEAGLELVQVNPYHTKRVKEIYDNTPNKTDYKDPKVIADIIELGRYLRVNMPQGVYAELRRLSQARDRHIGMRTQLINQLGSLMAVVFPEFMEQFSDVQGKTALYLIEKYTTPIAIQALGVGRLSKIMHKQSRGRLGFERAKELFEAASKSIGVHAGVDSMVAEIRYIVKTIKSVSSFIGVVEGIMSKQLEKVPFRKYLLSVKGIGVVTAAGIVGEIGDFSHYRKLREVLKLGGLNLYEMSSGARRGIRRISKRGRPLLRKMLYYAAVNMVTQKGIMRSYYERCISRGMIKTKALVAVMRKLLAILFAVVRNQTCYVTDYQNARAIDSIAA